MSYQVSPVGFVRSCFKEKFAIPRQPQLAPAARGDLPVELARLLARIDRGELADSTLAELAAESGISERTLRRQFDELVRLLRAQSSPQDGSERWHARDDIPPHY